MRIIDLLKKEAVVLGTSAASKEEAINKLISLHEKAGNLTDVEQYKKDILAREAQGTTAIGEGIAVPHAKSTAVKAPALAAITVPDGVDYDAPDGKPAKLLFMIAATTDGNVHLEILSRLMVMLMEPAFAESLMQAKDTEEFLRLIDEKETEKYPLTPTPKRKNSRNPRKKKAIRFWRLPPARPALPTPTWRRKRWRKKRRKWVFRLKSKPTAPAVRKTC